MPTFQELRTGHGELKAQVLTTEPWYSDDGKMFIYVRARTSVTRKRVYKIIRHHEGWEIRAGVTVATGRRLFLGVPLLSVSSGEWVVCQVGGIATSVNFGGALDSTGTEKAIHLNDTAGNEGGASWSVEAGASHEKCFAIVRGAGANAALQPEVIFCGREIVV